MLIEERYQKGLELLKRMLGEKTAEETRRRWQKLSPDFERYVLEFLSGEIWSRSGLPLKIKSLCTISALAALGPRWPGSAAGAARRAADGGREHAFAA